jgi:hypothetical protein
MEVLLAVSRARSGAEIWGLVWTALDNDPILLESRQFRGEAALKEWLVGVAANYGPQNIRVSWNEPLVADARLTSLLREVVEPPPSPRPEGS